MRRTTIALTFSPVDLLRKLVNGWPVHMIDELMPWTWADQHRGRMLAGMTKG